jgi:hypothetical protein
MRIVEKAMDLGFMLQHIFDGENYLPIEGNIEEAHAVLEDLDDAQLCFLRGINGSATGHAVKLIFDNGNEGRDVVADWNYYEGDKDGFSAMMNSILEWTDNLSPLRR